MIETTKSMLKRKVIILGSGPAGLTAAIYAARANLKPFVIAGELPGGQLMLTTDVENYPGFPSGIQGPELILQMRKQAERFGAEFLDKNFTSIDVSSRPLKVLVGSESFETQTIILATGADAKWLGLDSETRLRGHGVSSCATCDGAFFRDKKVLVVGGGDAAMEEATFLTKFASHVTVIHRREELRASKIMQERARSNPKIDFIFNAEVVEVLGTERVTGARINDTKIGEEKTLDADGIFIAIGHAPNTKEVKDLLNIDARGYIVPAERTATSIEGIFVAGDVFDYRYRQAITAAASGCMAAIDVEKYLEHHSA